jgi:surfeit locus 1 family protein
MRWREAFNSRVEEQMNAEPLQLNEETLDLDLYSLEYRQVMVKGNYLPEDEIVLRNQVWQTEFGTELGVALFTPLLIDGTNAAILVERGWITQDHADKNSRAIYIQEGTVTVTGRLRRAETDFSINEWLHPDPDGELDTWNNLNIERIAKQMEAPLLPVYLQLIPKAEQTDPPFASQPSLDLSEGPHLGYAIQWFIFAALLLIGYPLYVQRQERKSGQN